MKEKVTLLKSSMPTKSHWLEIEKEGSKLFVSLRSAKGIIGAERTAIKPVVLENVATMLPGVIMKNGPLRFYRTEDEMRVSFDELEPGLSGYDEIDEKQFVAAVSKVLDKDLTAKKARAQGKAGANKTEATTAAKVKPRAKRAPMSTKANPKSPVSKGRTGAKAKARATSKRTSAKAKATRKPANKR
jgi:hypothetical protein